MAIPTTHSQVPRSTFKTRASNCILLVISIVCVCVMVVCGVMIVREYSLAKEYEPSQCVVTAVEYDNDLEKCNHCSTGKEHMKEKTKGVCKESEFPCLRVMVKFLQGGRNRTGLLLPDSLHANGKYAQCSYSICLKTLEENRRKVAEEEQRYRQKIGHKMKCFYDTVGYHKVIVSKKHTKEQVIHSMVWPSVVIAICGVIFLKLEMKRRGISFCGDGTATGTGRQGPPLLKKGPAGHAQPNSQTVVQLQGNGKTMDCVIAHKPHGNKKTRKLPQATGDQWEHLSSSMSSLDRITKPKNSSKYTNVNETTPPPAKLGTSLSADGLKFHQINKDGKGTGSPSNKHADQSKYRQDSTQTNSSTGSQLLNKGVETPV